MTRKKADGERAWPLMAWDEIKRAAVVHPEILKKIRNACRSREDGTNPLAMAAPG
jgi:hypothetical protein